MSNLILHVCAIGFTAEKFLIAQAHYQHQNGYRVGFVFSPSVETEHLRNLGFEIYEISIPRNMNPLADLRSIYQMSLLFKRLKPVIIHTHTSKGGLVGRLAAFLAGIPNIAHTIHGFPFAEGMSRVKYWTFVYVERFLSLFTNIMFSQSEEDVILGRKYRILPKEQKIRHISNGIDLSRFSSRETLKVDNKLTLELKLKTDAVFILTIGRINYEKGYYEVIEALKELSKNVHLIAVGFDEGHKTILEKKIKEYKLEKQVHWLGLRQDIPDLMAQCQIFVLASHREGVPRSLIEAQAMGLACIATDIRGCREVIVKDQTGLLIPAKNALELRIALQYLLDNPEQAKKFALAGEKHARAFFDEQIVCEKIWKGYLEGFHHIATKSEIQKP
jgi:glycosyltransferase involved in cell wall biosynthesis